MALEVKPQWFFDEDLVKMEAEGLKNLKYAEPYDFTITKFQLDSYWLDKKYEEGHTLAYKSFQYHLDISDVRRELVDILARFAIKTGRVETLMECKQWLEKYGRACDTGLLWLRISVNKALGDMEAAAEAARIYHNLCPMLSVDQLLDII